MLGGQGWTPKPPVYPPLLICYCLYYLYVLSFRLYMYVIHFSTETKYFMLLIIKKNKNIKYLFITKAK